MQCPQSNPNLKFAARNNPRPCHSSSTEIQRNKRDRFSCLSCLALELDQSLTIFTIDFRALRASSKLNEEQ